MNTDGDWQDKVAVVTGASSGIGAATAKQLAREGMQVVLVARRLDRLEDLAGEIRQDGGQAYAIPADLTQESDRARVFQEVTGRFGNADVLVNNAGLGWYGYGNEMPWKTALEILQVNVEAVVQLTLGFLGKMRLRNAGHIINVGSISGSIPSQGVAVYGATKSFLDNFTTALYRELKGSRVHVSVVRAGPVRTEFGEVALSKENGGHVPTEHIGVTADYVAWRIWKLMLRPRRVIYVPDWLRVVPLAELAFGWIIDRVGPLLLKKQKFGM
ncbi:MAG: SDR family oxidoreductase [Chloroflexi bacterium]|nr:SDR family oxidoreductase [Chloroflexota bacterium]